MNPTQCSDSEPRRNEFLREVLQGLQQPRKTLPCKYFYDERGSRLFEQICELEEYYLTRTEFAIMRRHAAEMAAELGRRCLLVEYGSGSSLKTRILLDHLREPAAYVPVDVCEEHLQRTAAELAEQYPSVAVAPMCADFTRLTEPPRIGAGVELRSVGFNPRHERSIVYFPGSTIGNFAPAAAVSLLRQIARVAGAGGGLLIGFDLKKSPVLLEPAYNDRQGITAEFNRNLLVRINRELGGNFVVEQFRHHAFFNESESRIEMHLVSETDQTVRIGGVEIAFQQGETIHTENSYKYSLGQFREITEAAGFTLRQTWTDADRFFSVQYLRTS